MNKLQGEKDYLECKLENKIYFNSMSGETDSEKFNNLPSDDERYNIISFNNIDSSISVPFLMSKGYSQEDAINYVGFETIKSIKENAISCKARFDKKEGWWSILFTFFDSSVAQQIETVITNAGHFDFYCNSARFGTSYGDSEDALFDFIDRTGGYALGGITLLDFALKSEYIINEDDSDYIPVQTALKNYFR